MDYEAIIETAAWKCAESAVEMGLTLDHLTEGADLAEGDCEYIQEQFGRELSTAEWRIAFIAFVARATELLNA